MRSLSAAILISVSLAVEAIEAPGESADQPVCHEITVTHPKVTIISARAQNVKDGEYRQIAILHPDKPEDQPVAELTIRLNKKVDGVVQNVFTMKELPAEWVYAEVRVQTRNETPLATIPPGTKCVSVVYRKPKSLPYRQQPYQWDPRVFDRGIHGGAGVP